MFERKFLEDAVRAGVDSVLGPETIKSVNAAPREQTVVAMFSARRQLFRNIAANRTASRKFLEGELVQPQ